MSDPFLPYETSLMVLRYLYAQDCQSTAEEFMNEMPCLKNACKDPAKLILPSVFGGLNDILNDYGKTKLLVKDLVTKLTEWEKIPEDGVSPFDTLTTQLRFIIQLLSAIFGPSTPRQATAKKAPDKPKARQVSKSIQTSPDTSIIRTKKVVATCTTMDDVLTDCWSICSCLHSSKVDVKQLTKVETQTDWKMTEVETQTDWTINEDQATITSSTMQMQVNHNESINPYQVNHIEEISEAEDAVENEASACAVGEDGNESDSESDQKNTPTVAAKLFYSVALEDTELLNNIIGLANKQLTFQQQISDSPVKQDIVPPVGDTVSTGLMTEVDRFLEQMLSNDLETEMEEGEIVDDSQDNIGEFQAAEKNLASLFEKKLNSTPSSACTLAAGASRSTSLATNAPSDKQNNSVVKDDENHFGSLNLTSVQNQLNTAPNEIFPQETNRAPENTPKMNEVKHAQQNIQIQMPKVRNQSAWQKIGRRPIAPKIPTGQIEHPIVIEDSPIPSPPVIKKPEVKNSPKETEQSNALHPRPRISPVSQKTEVMSNARETDKSNALQPSPPIPSSPRIVIQRPEVNKSSASETEQSHTLQPPSPLTLQQQYVPQSRPGLIQHLVGAAIRVQESTLPKTSPQAILLPIPLSQRSQTTPRKKNHVRSLKFASPQVKSDQREKPGSSQFNSSTLPESKPITLQISKAQKSLFPTGSTPPNQVQHERNPASKETVPVSIQRDIKGLPKSQASKPDRKRGHSPDKKSIPDNSNRTKRTSSTSTSPSKKIRTEERSKVEQTSKRTTPEDQKTDKSRPRTQSNEKHTQQRGSYTASTVQKQSPIETRRTSGSSSKNVPALASSSNVCSSNAESSRNSESRRKRREPEKRSTTIASANQTQTQSTMDKGEVVSSISLQESLPGLGLHYNNNYVDLNFTVPRTPRYKGGVDSDWESQSCETFENSIAQRLPLLTPLKDDNLPDTPGKNLELQRDLADNVSNRSDRKPMLAETLNNALRRASDKQKDDRSNVYNFVSQLNKADHMPAYSFPQGREQSVNHTSAQEVNEVKNIKRQNISDFKPNLVIQSQMKEPVPVQSKPNQPQTSSLRNRKTPPAAPTNHANQEQSPTDIVKFAVAGKSKKLTHQECATAISLWQLSQAGSPDPKLLMTPQHSPLRELGDNLSATNLDNNRIEDVLQMLHGAGSNNTSHVNCDSKCSGI